MTSFPDMRHPLDAERLLGRAHNLAGDRIAFVVPPGVTWALPLYELALMTERHARERNYRDLEIEIVTPEPGPLAVFGPVASEAVAEMLKARGSSSRPARGSTRRTASWSSARATGGSSAPRSWR